MTEATVLPEAQAKLSEVVELTAKLGAAEAQLEKGWGALAFRLGDTLEKQYWRGSYKSFGVFLDYLSEAHHVSRSCLYRYAAAARELSGIVNEQQLTDMGVTKASLLVKAKKLNPILPAGIVEKAVDPEVTAEYLKEELFYAKNSPAQEEGTWMDLGFEFMVTAEERQVLEAAANAARHLDPPINDTHKPSAQKKEIAIRWAMEFLARYSDQVVDGGKGI